ncbi:MAG: lipid-A-disaccharide synthase [Bacteroidales bacterium]
MRYYIIAGEASGDLHASNLIRELKLLDGSADFRCWGGDLMEQQGAVLVKHYRDLAFMGFMEVASHLPTILKNFRTCEKDLLNYRPDVLILVDYPGFNLRMAKFARQNGIKVFYYISPQLWAWHASRVKSIRKWVDRMFVILPFEKEFYAGYDYRVDFQGHPLLDVVNEEMKLPLRGEFLCQNSLDDVPIIALLPGSRRMEIDKVLRVMTSVRSSFPGFQFVVAGAPSIERGFYNGVLGKTDIKLVTGQTYGLLRHSVAALVTSGTATLETALMGVPQVVCYRGNALSYQIAKRIVSVKYISLVNLICDKLVAPELIQGDLNQDNLILNLRLLIEPGPARDKVLEGYRELKKRLGGPGASARVAALMMQYLIKN